METQQGQRFSSGDSRNSSVSSASGASMSSKTGSRDWRRTCSASSLGLMLLSALLWFVLAARMVLGAEPPLVPEQPGGPVFEESPLQFLVWFVEAVRAGEWRHVIAIGLFGLISGVRLGLRKWKPAIDDPKNWLYRDVVLPLVPLVTGLVLSLGAALFGVKPLGETLWDTLSATLEAAALFKLWQAGKAVWRHRVWRK